MVSVNLTSTNFYSPSKQQRILPSFYQLGDDDVYCGRGSICFNHIGNRRFRSIVSENLQRYTNAVTKNEKSAIIQGIIDYVRSKSNYGGFVKRDGDSDVYYEVGDFVAREKTSQAFRDATKDKYKSSRLNRRCIGARKSEMRKLSHAAVENDSYTSSSIQNHIDLIWKPLQLYENECNTSNASESFFSIRNNHMNNEMEVPELCSSREKLMSNRYRTKNESNHLSNTPLLAAKYYWNKGNISSNQYDDSYDSMLSPIIDKTCFVSENETDGVTSALKVCDTLNEDAKTFDLLLEFTDKYSCYDDIELFC